ncbi:DUF1254 domain-containing protein [Pontibacter sp. G13]|uniref:DUF1254 domain-containing protein n=1 Tax=Pontibacter sp. G13 TaxID=3074898 RepID=UPI00288A1C74|nr:DUF1254 domain-containing protein [Pontibacter sp. G13]WNJ19448.1 DUF1254 domain-containing protein [Pontibacter sp. G13]
MNIFSGKGILIISSLWATMLLGTSCSHEPTQAELRDQRLFERAKEAYEFCYPMLANYRTLFTSALDPKRHAAFDPAINQLWISPPDSMWTTPPFLDQNHDTPYSGAWLFLGNEPMVLKLPKMEPNRYFSCQLIDFFTYNFAYLGTRESGNQGGTYLITGPGQSVDDPQNYDRIIRCETLFAFLIIRTEAFSDEDLSRVQTLQSSVELLPYSTFTRSEKPVATRTLLEKVLPYDEKLSQSPAFIRYANAMISWQPIHPDDQPVIDSMAAIGIGPEQPFLLEPDDPDWKTIQLGIDSAMASIREKAALVDQRINGWDIPFSQGPRSNFGKNYLLRSALAYEDLYGTNHQDAMSPTALVDKDGKPLTGRYSYQIVLDSLTTPPVDYFWSISAYRASDGQMEDNPIHRFRISSRDALEPSKDGRIRILLQHATPPPALLQNWLPIPEGSFFITMRLYGPDRPALDGRWQPAPIAKVKPSKTDPNPR